MAAPRGSIGFVMNTRKPQFADWRVREAMIELFNFEFINKTLNGGACRASRPTSATPLAMDPGNPGRAARAGASGAVQGRTPARHHRRLCAARATAPDQPQEHPRRARRFWRRRAGPSAMTAC
jgi:ABC-type oligopeptide transport system substrate-binding subunit